MRVRVPEALTQKGLTIQEVVDQLEGRGSQAALYRLIARQGRVRLLNLDLLEALCDILDLTPGRLLERSLPRRGRVSGRPRRRG